MTREKNASYDAQGESESKEWNPLSIYAKRERSLKCFLSVYPRSLNIFETMVH